MDGGGGQEGRQVGKLGGHCSWNKKWRWLILGWLEMATPVRILGQSWTTAQVSWWSRWVLCTALVPMVHRANRHDRQEQERGIWRVCLEHCTQTRVHSPWGSKHIILPKEIVIVTRNFNGKQNKKKSIEASCGSLGWQRSKWVQPHYFRKDLCIFYWPSCRPQGLLPLFCAEQKREDPVHTFTGDDKFMPSDETEKRDRSIIGHLGLLPRENLHQSSKSDSHVQRGFHFSQSTGSIVCI